MGVSYVTVHAAGGEEMLRAAVEGFEEGWADAVAAGHPEPAEGSAGVLAVTVLTSDPDASAALVGLRASLAAQAGCLGVVCAAADLPVVGSRAPGLLTVVPGIRFAESPRDDQVRGSRALFCDTGRGRPARRRQDRDRFGRSGTGGSAALGGSHGRSRWRAGLSRLVSRFAGRAFLYLCYERATVISTDSRPGSDSPLFHASKQPMAQLSQGGPTRS